MADEKSRLAEIYKAEKSKGGGIAITLGKRALEKLDPRQFFNQKGLMAAALPSLFKSYSATPANSGQKVSSLGSGSLSSGALETKLDVLIGETKDVKINSKLSAKNSMVLPDIARDMNVMRQNIQKLVKLQGGTAAKGTDMYFKKAGERESSYESQFGKEKFKTSPTLVGDKKEEKKEGGILGFLSTLFAPLLTLGATIASAITGTLATLFSPDNLVKVFGLGLDVIKGIGTAFRVLLPLLTNPVFLSIVGGLLAAKWLMDLIDKKNSEANTEEKKKQRIGDDSGSQSSKLAKRVFQIDAGLTELLGDDRTDEEVSRFTSGEIRTKDELRAKIAEAQALGKRAIEIKDSRVVEEARQERNKIADRMDAEIGAPEPPPLPRYNPAADSQAANMPAPTPAPTPAPQPPTTSPTKSSTTPMTTGPGGAAFGMYPKPGLTMPDKNIGSFIKDASERVGVDEGIMLAMANQESSFNPNAKPIDKNGKLLSSAKGLYQFLNSTWNDMVSKYSKNFPELLKGPLDPLASAIAGALYIKENSQLLAKAGIPITGTSIYAAHFLGPGGARDLFSADPSANASEVLPKAAASNKHIFYNKDGTSKSVDGVIQTLYGKVGQKAELYSAAINNPLSMPPSPSSSTAVASTSSGTSSPNQSAALAPNAPSSATTLAAATTAVSKEKMILASAAPIVNNVTNNNVNNTTAGGQSQGALPSVYDDMFSSLFQRMA